jgi:purine-cytosine permease-like protein
VAGNARLTGGAAVALLVLLAAEGATIPFIGRLIGPHAFIGMLLIPPVLLKLGSTAGSKRTLRLRLARVFDRPGGFDDGPL